MMKRQIISHSLKHFFNAVVLIPAVHYNSEFIYFSVIEGSLVLFT